MILSCKQLFKTTIDFTEAFLFLLIGRINNRGIRRITRYRFKELPVFVSSPLHGCQLTHQAVPPHLNSAVIL
jgi:hypothetical protein